MDRVAEPVQEEEQGGCVNRWAELGRIRNLRSSLAINQAQGQSELLNIKSNIKAAFKVCLLGILRMLLVGKSESLMVQWPHK